MLIHNHMEKRLIVIKNTASHLYIYINICSSTIIWKKDLL